MGQAKLRGTQEERIRLGIEKARLKCVEDYRKQHLALIERELNLTLKEREERDKIRMTLASLMGFAGL